MPSIYIHLNGKDREVPAAFTVADLVNELSLGEKRIALEINQEIVPRSQYRERRLTSGDVVEIVHAIGGG